MSIQAIDISERGKVIEIKGSIAKVGGLDSCVNGQLLDMTPNVKGFIMGFNNGVALVLLLGKIEEVRIGQEISAKREEFRIPVGDNFVGRVVSALATPLDGKSPPITDTFYPLFRDAPSVLARAPVNETFETGTFIIDTTTPIGKGQRQLILGDRMTGKTTIGIDAILNQKGKGSICIYCCIGHALRSLEGIVKLLKEKRAFDYSIVVSATASTASGEQYLAPYTACTLGEYFMYSGKDVFIVFDDLTKHAWAYRQISLLLERPPGRDAYPGDIFYLHSQLMERAAKLISVDGVKGGSMTFFPIADTYQGDITSYVTSNIISMTDGQIFLNALLFNQGFAPAVDLGLSVSRIGSKAQFPVIKELSGMLRLEYLKYNELLKVSKLKANLSESLVQQLRHGEIIQELFMQDKNTPWTFEEEALFLYALRRNVLDVLPKDDVERFKRGILKFARDKYPQLMLALLQEKKLTPEIRKGLDECLIAFFKNLGVFQKQEKA
ncbi:MAG: F0F1 ATP synthase subunit alpha [Candidatus Omnitrophota bacterium]